MAEVDLVECDCSKAQRIQMLLDEEDINCRIIEPKDGFYMMTSGNMIPLYLVRVNSSQIDRAREIVRQVDDDMGEELSWCPECGSYEIEKVTIQGKHGPNWLLYIMLLSVMVCIVSFFCFNVIILPGLVAIVSAIFYFRPYTTTKCQCRSCGHIFTHY